MCKYILLLTTFILSSSAERASALEKNITWIEIDVYGWTVVVDSSLIEGDTSLLRKSLGYLGKELYNIKNAVNPAALGTLQSPKIYLVQPPSDPYWGVYYRQHYNREDDSAAKRRRGNIEVVPGRYITCVQSYGEWLLMHELAHAFHDRLTSEADTKIKNAYNVAMAMRLYRSVRSKARRYRHGGYAQTNHHEYFAELSTAYFGKNDSYPFDRFDLKGHDPLGYSMIIELWGEKKDK